MKAGSLQIIIAVQLMILISGADDPSVSQLVFTIMERASIRTFSWLKVDMKLGRQHNNHNHKGSAAIKHYANQPTRPL